VKVIATALAISISFLAVSVVLAHTQNAGDKLAAGAAPKYDPVVYAELQKAPEKARNRPNPLQNDPDAVAAGAILFGQHCAECHGDAARGGKKGPKPPRRGSSRRRARRDFLDPDEWCRSKGDACMVEGAGTPALAMLVRYIKSLGEDCPATATIQASLSNDTIRQDLRNRAGRGALNFRGAEAWPLLARLAPRHH